MKLQSAIAEIPDCEFFPDKDLTSLTTMKLESQGDLVEVHSVAALQRLLPLLSSRTCPYLVVGWGANQILPARCQGVVIHLKFPFDTSYLNEPRDLYVLPASLGLNHLTAHAVKHNLAGWEVFTGIPASLGGAIYMNAGTNLGEIGGLVTSVRLVTPAGELRTHRVGAGSFSYRRNGFVAAGEVIVEVSLVHRGYQAGLGEKIKTYLEYRRSTQPLSTRNCGCVFKNPHRELPAGKMIDLLGLKGVEFGSLRISQKHGNFFENAGGARWEELETLIKTVQFQMDVFYGIEFELEVKIPYH